MTEAVIVSAVRTAVGRGVEGTKSTRVHNIELKEDSEALEGFTERISPEVSRG